MKPPCPTIVELVGSDNVGLNFVNDLLGSIGTEEDLNILLAKMTNADADATSADHIH